MKLDINMGTIWTMLVGTAMAIIYMFTTFATAADLQQLDARIIKADIRQVRKLLREEEDDTIKDFYREDLRELIDDLCDITPEHRYCDIEVETNGVTE